MLDPSAGHHPAGGDDDLGHGIGSQFLGPFGIADIFDHPAHGAGVGGAQPVFADMAVEQDAGIDGHRAVQIDRDGRQPAGTFQPPQMPGQQLGAADRKGGNDHGAAAPDGTLDNIMQQVGDVAAFVQAVAIGGFQQEKIGAADRVGIRQQRIVLAAQIAGKHDAPALPVERDGRRAEDVAGPAEHQPRSGDRLDRLAEFETVELFHRGLGVFLGVERQRRIVAREALAIGVFGIALLEIAAVGQQDFAQIPGRRGAQDGAAIPVLDEAGDIAGMIEMGVGQGDGVDPRGVDAENRTSCGCGCRAGPGTCRSRAGCPVPPN